MLTLALTLTLSTLHLPPPSSLSLIDPQVDAQIAADPIRTTWPTGSVVLMAVGFGGATTFTLAGFLLAVALGGLPGILMLGIGLTIGGLGLMHGIAGVIWGAASAGAARDRIRKLEAQPGLVTLATF